MLLQFHLFCGKPSNNIYQPSLFKTTNKMHIYLFVVNKKLFLFALPLYLVFKIQF